MKNKEDKQTATQESTLDRIVYNVGFFIAVVAIGTIMKLVHIGEVPIIGPIIKFVVITILIGLVIFVIVDDVITSNKIRNKLSRWADED